MALKEEYQYLIFPSGKSASSVYLDAIEEARLEGIPLWEALSNAVKFNGMPPLSWEGALVDLQEQAFIEAQVAEHGEPNLVHSLGIQISKRFFLDKAGQPIEVSDTLDRVHLKQFKLTRLVLISLSVEGASIHAVQMVPYTDDIVISSALIALWSKCDALLGVPNTIKISKSIEAFAPEIKNLFLSGVPEVCIVDGKDRRHTANLNAIQNTFIPSSKKIFTLEDLNSALLNVLTYIHEKQKRICYKALKVRQPTPLVYSGTSLVVTKDSVKQPKDTGLKYSTLLGQNHTKGLRYYIAEGNEVAGFQSSLIEDNWYIGVLKSLPFTPGKLANLIGCDTKQVHLYLQNRSPLPSNVFWNLCQMLNVEFGQAWDECPPYPQYFGPLLLTPKSKKDLISAYYAVSRGGDLEIAYEMVSTLLSPYRYLIVEAYGDFYIFRLEKDWPSCGAINNELLLNFSGKILIKDFIFQKIESLCEEAISFPEEYHRILSDFFRPWSQLKSVDVLAVDYWSCDSGDYSSY